ncbi:Metallo-dependent phosphatase-like protein [Pavlovales sp. CCMP2436]|nr:Metallo-dependent phosphatase-like protein [Pavlovales sp. CCMP2436]
MGRAPAVAVLGLWAGCLLWTGWLLARSGLSSPLAANIPPELHAALPDMPGRQRVVIIGDVHGCIDELNRILVKVKYRPASDQIILLGDLVDKGPSVAALVRWAREHKISAVRGNHDEALLQYIRQIRCNTQFLCINPGSPTASEIFVKIFVTQNITNKNKNPSSFTASEILCVSPSHWW